MGYRQDIQIEEDKLTASLFKIYRKIQADLKNGASWIEIQSIYQKKTDDAIRSSVTTIYELSARKTVERDIKVPYFLTQKDLETIRTLAQRYQQTFWLSLDREINMHSTIGVKSFYDPETLLIVREQDTRLRQGFIGRITQSIHGQVKASAVLSKARQVIAQPQKPNRIRSAAIETNKTPVLRWQADGDACPICDALNDTAYLVDDPNTPIPSQDTHPRCKCELVLEDASLEGDVTEAADLFF